MKTFIKSLRRRFLFATVVLGLCLGGRYLPAQSKTDQEDQKGVSTVEDARIYREAMVWFKKAEALIGTPKENSDEQAELFQKAVEIMPDFVEAHYNLGLIYANQKKLKEAVLEFEEVLRIEPKFSEGIYFLLASGYQQLGESGKAMEALEKGLQRNPEDLKMLKALAYLQREKKLDTAAIPTLQRILEMDPADVSARIELALLYQKSGDIENAVKNYEDALTVDPDNFAAHYNLGLIYTRQQKSAEAAKEFEEANRVQPGNPELLERLGDAYAFQQQHEEAAKAYKTALEKAASPDGALYAKLGFSLAHLNRIEEAVDALENAARLDPQNSEVLHLLGDLYADLKRKDDAITAYKKSLEIDPGKKEVHYNLGTLYAENGMMDEALSELKAAVQLDPDYASAWANLALVAEKLDLDDQAIESHEKLVALGKARASNYFHLGVLYAKNNRPDPAIAAFAQAIKMEPDKYRALLKEELKKVVSILDPIRYKPEFTKLLSVP